VTPSRAFDLLVKLIGRAAAQVVCFVLLWSLIGIGVRLYVWLDGRVPGGIDPVRAAIFCMIALGAFVGWRMIANARLDE
jgi:hypothetical protein